MKKILNEWNKYVLKEASISRVHEHIMEHEAAFITAYRNNPSDYTKCYPNHSTNETNFERNKELKAVLLERGYGVTKVEGIYIEDYKTKAAKKVKEKSLFVVNLVDDPEFYDLLFELSEHYCQDSFLYVPQGGDNTLLVGTNSNDFPGYGGTEDQGSFIGGIDGEFMSYVGKRRGTGKPGSGERDEKRNRPPRRQVKFARKTNINEGLILDTKASMQNNTKYIISVTAKKVLKELEDKKNK